MSSANSSSRSSNCGQTAEAQLPVLSLEPVVTKISDSFCRESGQVYPTPLVTSALSIWLSGHTEFISQALEAALRSPENASEFKRILETLADNPMLASKNVDEADNELIFIRRKAETGARPVAPRLVAKNPDASGENIFNGFRKFSLDRMALMVNYIAERVSPLYKTKLNKLLFYSDFVNFHLSGKSISGAVYVHLPFGPVPDCYESVLERLASSKYLQIIKTRTGHGKAEIIESGPKASFLPDRLSGVELKTLDWVIREFGRMTVKEIIDASHQEKAYRYTLANEKIAYSYARFINRLPEHQAVKYD